MLRLTPRSLVAAVLAIVAPGSVAFAQFGLFGGGRDCGCGPATGTVYQSVAYNPCAPVAQVSQTACTPMVPVVQQVYQSVPVTEYQPVKRTVKKAVPEVKMVQQEYTEYRPVNDIKVVNVPTVSYQDVTEHQCVQRQTGYWVNRPYPVAKMSPCEYDQRQGFMGWMSRSSYDFKNAITPNVQTRREFVPQTVVQQVPVTRRVAIQGTKQVTYNTTSYVAEKKVRQVAVNSVRWEDDTVTAYQPVTVMKTVAVGSQTAYAPLGSLSGGSQTALRPTPDSTIQARQPDRSRSANRPKEDDGQFQRDNRSGSLQRPAEWEQRAQPVVRPASNTVEVEPHDVMKPVSKPASLPPAARVGRWVARTPVDTPTRSEASSLSLVDADR